MKKIINAIGLIGILALTGLCLSACHRDLDVQQSYPFKVETMPVQKDIAQGETAEIRCTLLRGGHFSDTRYTLRYFQYEGKGHLRIGYSGDSLIPNDRYPIQSGDFRLYYRSESRERQSLELVFEDNYGQQQTIHLDFNAKQTKDETAHN